MAESIQRGNLRVIGGGENTEKKGKGKVIIIALLFVAGVLFAIYMLFLRTDLKTYQNYRTLTENELAGQAVSFEKYNGGVLKCGKDGIEAWDKDGKAVLNIAYTMKNPVTAVCGKSVVIGDRGGNKLYISLGDEMSTQVDVIYPIIDVSISRQGVVAVWSSDDDKDYIYIYDINGKLLAELGSNVIKEGMPVDIALSLDGRKLAVTYIAVSEDAVKSWLTYYNFSEVGQNYIDKIVGSFSQEEGMTVRVDFPDEEHSCAISTTGFSIYKIKELPELLKEEHFTEEILSYDISGSNMAFVTRNSSGNDRYHILVYDMKGSLVFDTLTNMDYEKIELGNNELSLYDSTSCTILYFTGEVKYSGGFGGNINTVFPTSNVARYFLLHDSSYEIIELYTTSDEVVQEKAGEGSGGADTVTDKEE